MRKNTKELNRRLLLSVIEWMNRADKNGGQYESYIEMIESGYTTLNEVVFSIENILSSWLNIEKQKENGGKAEEILKQKARLIYLYE